MSGKFLTSVFPGMMLPLKQILLNQSYIKLYYWIKAISNCITDLAQETESSGQNLGILHIIWGQGLVITLQIISNIGM